jgi:hypothetical protein
MKFTILTTLAAILLLGAFQAHAQSSGTSTAGDGITTWSNGSGRSTAGDGITTWSNGSGRSTAGGGITIWTPLGGRSTAGGGITTWTGPAQIVITPNGPLLLIPQ